MTARKFLALPLAFVGGVILASFAACTETNDSHCSAKGGDVYCQDKTGKAEGEVFCTNNCGGDYDFDGCLVASEAPAEGCWLCDGNGSENCGSIGDGDSDTTDTETTADTETTTDATDTMDTTTESGPECTMSAECAMPEAPLCDGEACVGCGDAGVASCAADYPATPVCDVGTGACVECSDADVSACPAEAPACEGGVCVPCDEHEQCPDSACNMSTGACMDPQRVWWVNQSVVGPGTGTMEDPYKEFASALANVGAGEEGTIYFATPGTHTGQVQVLGNRTVAIVGKVPLGFIQFFGASALDLNQSSTVFVHAIKVSGGDDFGVRCNGCSLWMTKSRIVNNTGGGITLSQSGDVRVANSFVGGDVSDKIALDIVSGTVDVVYSTLFAGFGVASAVRCGVDGGTDSSIRNSMVLARAAGAEVNACAQIDISASVLESALPNNTAVGDPNVAWFVGVPAGDFRLLPAAPATISTAATWQTGDPSTDIEGDARPTTDGTVDYAGADVLN